MVADTRERRERRVGDGREQRLRVAEPQREVAAGLEVPRRERVARDIAVDLLNLLLEIGAVDERRGVRLRQRRGRDADGCASPVHRHGLGVGRRQGDRSRTRRGGPSGARGRAGPASSASRASPSSAAKAFSVGPYQVRKKSTNSSADSNLKVNVRSSISSEAMRVAEERAQMGLGAPEHRRLHARRRRHVGADGAEELADEAVGRPAGERDRAAGPGRPGAARRPPARGRGRTSSRTRT